LEEFVELVNFQSKCDESPLQTFSIGCMQSLQTLSCKAALNYLLYARRRGRFLEMCCVFR